MSQVWNVEPELEPHIIRRIGLRAHETADGAIRGEMTIGPALRTGSGFPLLGPVGSFTDTIGGVLAAIGVYPTPIATADLGLALDPSCRPEAVHATPRIVRAGRTSVVTEMTLTDEHDAPVGYCTMTSTVLSDREPQQFDPRVILTVFPDIPLDDPTPLYDQIGLAAGADPQRGGSIGARLVLAPFLGNSMGMMHGGVTVMVADAVAAAVARQRFATDQVATVDAHVRYLNGARVGPVLANATVVAADDRSVTVRVEQCDEGREGRLTSIATARAAVLA